MQNLTSRTTQNARADKTNHSKPKVEIHIRNYQTTAYWYDFYKDMFILFPVLLYRCAVSSKPFNVKGPFEPNPDAPGYKASYSTGVGLKYVAISGLFLAAGFIETNQVIFRCYYRFCDDPECFTNVSSNSRYKQSAI